MKRVQPVYHAFTVKHQGIWNRIRTEAAVFPAFDPEHLPDPLPKEYRCLALWDTGATGSVITAATAAALGLIPVGTANISHAGGNSVANTYMVHIGLPNNILVTSVLVSETPDTTAFGLIIGMNIITTGDFAITNVGGNTVLSFCYPSKTMIDYVVEVNKMRFAGVGRNDLCPCGSGKKFKFCHINEK